MVRAFCPSLFGSRTYEVVSWLIDSQLIKYFFNFLNVIWSISLFSARFVKKYYLCPAEAHCRIHAKASFFFLDKKANVFVPFLWFFFVKNRLFKLRNIFLQAGCLHSSLLPAHHFLGLSLFCDVTFQCHHFFDRYFILALLFLFFTFYLFIYLFIFAF